VLESIEEILNNTAAPGTPFRIVLTEGQLTAMANNYLSEHAGLALSDATVKLEPDLITVAAKTQFGGLPIRLEVAGSPVLVGEGLRILFNRITLNGAPAPAFIANRLVESVNRHLDHDNLPLVIEAVEVAAGQATIAGRIK